MMKNLHQLQRPDCKKQLQLLLTNLLRSLPV